MIGGKVNQKQEQTQKKGGRRPRHNVKQELIKKKNLVFNFHFLCVGLSIFYIFIFHVSFHNVVSGTWGFFSMKDLSTKGLIRQVKREMLSIKNSITPRILYDFFQALLRFAPGLSPPTKFYDYYCDMPHGVFTNVPGTTLPIAFAGEEIQEFRSFPPQSGKGSIGIALISYCGKVSIGAIADIHRKYPGLANGVCNRFTEEFDSILEEAKIELSKKKKL